MTRIPRLTLAISVGLLGVTLVLGLWGWSQYYAADPRHNFFDALYHTLLAITGDYTYVVVEEGKPLNLKIEIARFTGFMATISAIFGVAALFLHNQIMRLVATWRKDHIVIVGASDFVIDTYKREKITLFETEENVTRFAPLQPDTIVLVGPLTKSTATGPTLGRPKAVVFGGSDTAQNVERAQIWLSEREETDEMPELILQVEDGSVARDLQLFSGKFRKAKLISRSDTIARALITSMAPTDLAKTRAQDHVHLVLIGLGSVNLAVAEEAALRCHDHNLGPLRLTIIDVKIDGAHARIRRERPKLYDLERAGVTVKFIELDALECCSSDRVKNLLDDEAKFPITALVVSTGNDTRNTAIAMRLRQLQTERMCLRAPIFMRSDSLASVSANVVRDLTSGVVPFGGSRLDDEDLELDRLYHDLAEAIHERWRALGKQPPDPDTAWEQLSNLEQRPNYRAALSAVELFYAAGFVPPVGRRVAGLRVFGQAANDTLGDDDLILKLSEREHNRWMAERTMEGYQRTDGYRDDEKKLHPLIQPFGDLPEAEKLKDEVNVKETISRGIEQYEAADNAPCWRMRRRIGLVGPLTVDAKKTEEDVVGAFNQLIAEEPGLADCDLEIMTPNAPGFDRLGAIALATAWKARTDRPARLLLLNVADPALVDRIAAEHVADDEDARKAAVKRMESETETLSALEAEGHLIRTVDCRPLGISNADLDHDRTAYGTGIERVQDRILAQADMMIFDHENGASWTQKAITRWAALEKREAIVL
ncbi:RyR domain-containing protein [Hoeflea sp. AS16]|uniref:RyR domain-containing protein n=1 Tax=Hoeflea sp. AS16 TaxID=3135779 RepID=UPI0031744120